LYFSDNFLISGIYSCQIPNAEVSPPVEIALKAPDHIPGLILTQTEIQDFIFPITSNCFRLVATINTPLPNKSANSLGVSCHEICISFALNQACIALYASYSELQSTFIPAFLNIFNIFILAFAFIAYLTVCQKAEGKDKKDFTDSSNINSL